ncbi:hypothetical protein [Pueribacillus sp. YX66]
MNFINMDWLGFEEVIVKKSKNVEGMIHFHVEYERKSLCGQMC